jgi:hypothetical protein
VIRVIDGVGLLFLGTALAGSEIAIGNVLPVVIRRDLPTEWSGIGDLHCVVEWFLRHRCKVDRYSDGTHTKTSVDLG